MTFTTTIWRNFRRLTEFERGVVFKAGCMLLACRMGLRILGFRTWKNLLVHFLPHEDRAKTTAAGSEEIAKAIARMVAAAGRNLFFTPDCLESSLTLWWLLRRRGFAADLRFGARKEMNTFEAHAWVEWNGLALSDPGDGQSPFVPFEEHFAAGKTHTP